MVRYCLLVIFATSFSCFLLAQKADDIVGFYYTIDPFSDEESQVEIYKEKDGSYSGKVVWIKSEKNRKDEGYFFLWDLKYNEKDQEWQNGKIKYPGKPGTFDTYMKFEGNTSTILGNRLKVRGYWKLGFLGKTVYWTKETKKRTH